MKLIEKYVSKINISDNKFGGFSWLHPDITDIPQKQVKMLKFEHFYAGLICGFIDLNWHEKLHNNIKATFNNYKDYYNYFQKNKEQIRKDECLYKEYKTTLNSFYGKLEIVSIMGHAPDYRTYISQYLNHYYNDLIQKNSDSILYIDTDVIFFKDEINLLELENSYEIQNIDYILFCGLKKYVYFREKDKCFSKLFSSKDSDQCLQKLKSFVREDMITKLGF